MSPGDRAQLPAIGETFFGADEQTISDAVAKAFDEAEPFLEWFFRCDQFAHFCRPVYIGVARSLYERIYNQHYLALSCYGRSRPTTGRQESFWKLSTMHRRLPDPVQAKCRALLFDGTGNRHVFEEHVDRLKENARELREQGQAIPAHLSTQLNYCESVSRALLLREESVKLNRSFLLFNIDVQNFQNRDKTTVDDETRMIRARGKAIFDTVSTQAFQIGYLMAVLSHVEILLPVAANYDDRLATTEFVSAHYL